MEHNLNSTKKYVIRSFHYFIRMVILFLLIFLVMWLTNTLRMESGDSISSILFSRNIAILIGAIILLAGIYPKVSFGTIIVRADMEQDNKAIMDSFATFGYSISRQNGNITTFRANTTSRRMRLRYDDAITVLSTDGYIYIEGLKREIIRVDTKLDALLNSDKD